MTQSDQPQFPRSPEEALSADAEIAGLADRLQALKQSLGAAYWQDADVQALQQRLRRQLSGYASWSEDKLPPHQRARRAAKLESQCAPLLWPGRADE